MEIQNNQIDKDASYEASEERAIEEESIEYE